MQLIIEHSDDGRVFFYEESDRHHKKVEPWRAKAAMRRTLEDLAKDCAVQMGEYLVIPIIEV